MYISDERLRNIKEFVSLRVGLSFSTKSNDSLTLYIGIYMRNIYEGAF